MVARHFAASLAVSIILALFVEAQQEGQQEGEQCLLQRSRSKVNAHVNSAFAVDKANSSVEVDLFKSLAWTTNIGQDFHDCSGSKFKIDYSGTHGGMVVKKGMLLKKGMCTENVIDAVPTVTQELSCEANATGCHMWCAPVWQSHNDKQDWGAFDSRCKDWDGSFNTDDTECGKMGKIFTWARVELPENKNQLDFTYAISKKCTRWCSPLWVTIYDRRNWAKSYRWCFNRKDDWGVCDEEEDVSLGAWHDTSLQVSKFMQKHGYLAEHLSLELAVYSEFEDPEVMINSIKLSYVQEVTTTQVPKLLVMPCGSEPSCGTDHQCCRKDESEVDAKCCPKDWSCCEDSCCPSYYNCTITESGHTCKPPLGEVYERPELCSQTPSPSPSPAP